MWADDFASPFQLAKTSPVSERKAPQRLAAKTTSGAATSGILSSDATPITTAGCNGVCGGDCDGACGNAEAGGCAGDCGGGCSSCGNLPIEAGLCTSCPGACCCCPPKRYGFFVDGLYLRPGNADVTYAVERTGCNPNLSSPTGQVGRVAPDFELGSRIGFEAATCNGGVIRAAYTMLESHTEDRVFANGANVLHSQVTHPSAGEACDVNSQFSSANYDIDFNLIDVDYRYRFLHGGCGGLDFVAGVRYAHLEQEFVSQQIIALPSGQTYEPISTLTG